MHEGKIQYRSPLDARGFTMLHNAVLLDTRLSDGAKVTYMVLMHHARQDDHCFPGQERLCAERGLKERALRSHLAELEAARLITRERRGKTPYQPLLARADGDGLPGPDRRRAGREQ